MLRNREIVVLILLILTIKAHAADVNYNLRTTFAQYDNVNLVNQPVEKEYSQSVGAGFRIFEDSSSLYANFRTDISYINYKNDIAADETNGQLFAGVVWRVKPGQFEWVLDNNFTQSVVDPLSSNAPSNRQNINVFSTGPNYVARINSRNNLQIEARAEKYSFEDGADNKRFSSAIRWLHDINPALVLSINDEGEITSFGDEIENSNFQRNDVFLGLDYFRGANTFNAEYGITRIKNDNIRDVDSGRYLLSFSNARTQSSVIQFTYENLLSDTGRDVLRFDPDEELDGEAVQSVVNDIFVNEIYRLRYIKNLSVADLNIDVFTNDINYKILTNLDEDSEGASMRLSWGLQSRNSLNFNASRVNTFFNDPSINRNDIDKIYSIDYTYNLNRNIDVRFEVTSLDRLSTLEIESYEDLRMFLSLIYTSL